MSHQHSFLSVDSYSRSQAAEHMLNTAVTQAKISESVEEYLDIFDKFYADEIHVSSENQHEPIRGKARVGSLLLNFVVPLHVMAEVGGLANQLKRPRHLAMMRTRSILPGPSTLSASLVKPVRRTGALSGNGTSRSWCTSITMTNSEVASR